MQTPNTKDNMIKNALEEVRQIERDIGDSEEQILERRIKQGKLLAELKDYTQGVEPPVTWEVWVSSNLTYSRKTADNYINLSKWYLAHFEAGKADKEAYLANRKPGDKQQYRHDGFTSFNAVLEILSKRARVVKAATKPAKKGNGKAKAPKPRKVSKKDKFDLFHRWSAKLYEVVKNSDPKNPVLAEIDTAILFDAEPASLASQTEQPAVATAKPAAKQRKGDAGQGGGDRLAAD
jgi:hypothetical protein